MAPPGIRQDFAHRLRRAHPMNLAMRRHLATSERAGAEEIRRYQERRLRMLVRLAGRSSRFYREWFRTHDVSPHDIRTLADLSQLPLLSRSDLVEHADDFRVYPRQFMWAAKSSGTSGALVTSYRTPGSSVFELAILERQWSWFGLPRDSRRVVLRGSDFASDQDGIPTARLPGANQLLVSSFQLTASNAAAIVAEIRAFKPHAIEGWPSSIALLAAILRETNTRIPVRAIITSSEVISPGQRALMQEIFEGPIVDHYGQTERVAMLGVCEQGNYHVFPEYGIVEFLPVSGTVNRWEIVGTPLHNWGFPLFRYRTGDEVASFDSHACACRRAFDRVGGIDGRAEDTFIAADGRLLPLPSTVLDDLTGLRESQIAQLAPGNFEVRIVPGTGYDAQSTAAQVHYNIERLFGDGQSVTIRTYSSLPRTASGKLKAAIVENQS